MLTHKKSSRLEYLLTAFLLALALLALITPAPALAVTDYAFAGKWGSPGSGNSQFSGPYGVAVGPGGNVYVADTWYDRIQIFTDTVAPTGSILINSGAVYTKSKVVTLSLLASDGAGSGLSKMRFKNDSGAWSTWYPYAAAKSWTLGLTNGTRRVYAQFKDIAGNISSAVSDTISLDTKAPRTKLRAPRYSTDVSRTRTFRVYWKATDPAPSSGIAGYDVQ